MDNRAITENCRNGPTLRLSDCTLNRSSANSSSFGVGNFPRSCPLKWLSVMNPSAPPAARTWLLWFHCTTFTRPTCGVVEDSCSISEPFKFHVSTFVPQVAMIPDILVSQECSRSRQENSLFSADFFVRLVRTCMPGVVRGRKEGRKEGRKQVHVKDFTTTHHSPAVGRTATREPTNAQKKKVKSKARNGREEEDEKSP